MRIIVFGGTGFIGTRLIKTPEFMYHDVYVVTRDPSQSPPGPNVRMVGYTDKELVPLFSGDYAVVNLAGTGIADRLWTPARKKKIHESRVRVTQYVSKLIEQAPKRPRVILQGSAIGYYGSRGEEPLIEISERGSGFLPRVVYDWESALRIRSSTLVRIVMMRTGLVLGEQGLLKKLVPVFKMYLGGHIGNGQQWMPWIHIDDQIRAMLFLLFNEDVRGVFNLVGPDPVRMKEFTRVLGHTLNRPSWLPIPSSLIRMIPYGFGEELLLTSQYVLPERLTVNGFEFKYKDLEQALINLFYYD